MKPLNFAIIKLTFFLISGIVLGFILKIQFSKILIIVSLLLVLIKTTLILTKKRLGKFIWLDFTIALMVIFIGITTTTINDDKQFKSHYSQLNGIKKDSAVDIQIRIREVLKPSNFHTKYIGIITKVNQQETTGRILINIVKDTNDIIPKVDDIILTRTELQAISGPLNPFQFNYKKYLEKKHIYHQIQLNKNNFITLDATKHSIFGYAAYFRERINEKLENYHLNPDVHSIFNALVLGQRQDISKEIYESYTQAGAVHILAVSGLHIGILLMLLNYLFKPLEYIKNGKSIKIVSIIIILWCYAIIAGLSASVTRAVSMFTLFAIALNLKRPTNTYNTLAISMFLLLLFNPNFLLDLGFQLSYLAVLAIVGLEPILFGLWKPKYKLINFFWRILTVTFAAQIGVLPISLFYFHHFPGLFFLSNLVIIPFLGFILGFGFVIVILALTDILPSNFVYIYSYIIEALNNFVIWVSNQEDFLFQNISFNVGHVVFSYSIICLIFIYFKNLQLITLRLILILVIAFQGLLIYQKLSSKSTEFIVFHKTRYTILGFRENRTMKIHHSDNLEEALSENSILNFKIAENIKKTESETLKSVYKLNDKLLLIIDSLGIYKTPSFRPKFVLLRNSPKINLNRLIDSLQPELIISDGSNYKSYQKRWKATCLTKKIPFHQTSEKGAYIFKY